MRYRQVTTIGLVFLGMTGFCATSRADDASGSDDTQFSTLYRFEAPDPTTSASALGSEPDTRPVLGPDHTVYGMTLFGGSNANGVIYRFDLKSNQYTVLHTFTALDANGTNEDGAIPGVALTRGPGDVFFGMAQNGGKYGSGTIFQITPTGEFTVLHTFSAVAPDGTNPDGAHPLRTIVIGKDGNLYGTTRVGGMHQCGVLPRPNGCGVAWVMDRSGDNFKVLHQFTPPEGHAASLLQARDGLFYGCGVWPFTALANGTPLPSGILFRMTSSGSLDVLYTFRQTDAKGTNLDGADCYEPLVETESGVFYGTGSRGGPNGTGVVFRYSLSKPGMVEIVHSFSAVNAGVNVEDAFGRAVNSDGGFPIARLTLGEDGTLYSTAEVGGANGNGVIYRIRPDGDFKVLYTFRAANPTTGANPDGVGPDFGVVLHEDRLIGIANYGGNGSSAGLFNSGGTLYQLKLDD